MSKIVEVSGSNIDSLINLYSNDPIEKIRIKTDYDKGYFKGVMSLSETQSILGYLIYFNTYSTWQHRCHFVSNIWLSESIGDEQKFIELKAMFDRLLEISRNNDVNRINMNMNQDGNKIIEWTKLIGALDLSEKEDWFIMEMQSNEMKEFMSENPELKSGFKLTKVTDINAHALEVREAIFDLAVFEKMEDQCETTEAGLIRDYQKNSKYYELVVLSKEIVDEKTGEKRDVLAGFSIYFLRYDLKSGLGFVLEDLFVKEEYRGEGLGTALWRFVIRDIMSSSNALYMQWTVLSWNQKAIDLYVKYKSRNLTTLTQTHFFRILKETILQVV